MPPFEVRYLDVAWSDPSSVLKLEASREALEIKRSNDGWIVETTTFPSTFHYIGFATKQKSLKHTPYFNLAQGGRQELSPLKVPGSDDIWWVQTDKWDKKGKRYFSSLFRTAGRATLVIQDEQLAIENNTSNFTVSEIEYYLADFKNSLWMLIFDNSSAAKASIKKEMPDCFNVEVIKLFHEFIQAVEKLTKSPNISLIETQGKVPKRSVRPVPLTFREYATQPNSKLLTSRIFQESFDTAENRYIHYSVNRIMYILDSLSNVAHAQTNSLRRKIEREKELGKLLETKEFKKVNSNVYDNEIATLKGDLSALKKSVLELISSDSCGEVETCKTYIVKFGGQYGHAGTEYFANCINGINIKKKHGKYVVVRLPDSSNYSVVNYALRLGEVAITGRHRKSIERNKSGEEYFLLQFYEVTKATVVNHPWDKDISRLIQDRIKLENDGWIVSLTNEDIKDLKLENEVTSKKLEMYTDLAKNMSDFASPLPIFRKRLRKVASFLNAYKVKSRPDYPNGMVFVQNSSYGSAKSYFSKITALSGLSESTLNSLMAIDDIGLVNVANLYEKWCLLQIITVLTQVYGFKMDDGWQSALITSVLNREYDIEIKLFAPERQLRVVLSYEKWLDSGKRPDFILDIYSINDGQDPLKKGDRISGVEGRNRFVIDAKFRGEMTEQQLHELVAEIHTDKNYSEDEANQVFVMHPSPDVINHQTSPLAWGGNCDYGQSNKQNHRFGAIFVSPSLKHRGTPDNLQRLLGMFLQQQSIILNGQEEVSWHNMSCISCGNCNSDALDVVHEPTKRGSDRWLIKCELCAMLTVKTICFNCKKPLFKNGPRWTYHRTRAVQTSNILCPACETFLGST